MLLSFFFFLIRGATCAVRVPNDLYNPKAGHMRPGARTRVASQGCSCIIFAAFSCAWKLLARALRTQETPVPVPVRGAPGLQQDQRKTN